MEKKNIKIFIICYLVIGLTFLSITPWAFSVQWISSNESHSLLEIVQTFIAIGVGVISIMYFLVLNNLYYLFIGLGFNIAASNDLIHGILSYGPIMAGIQGDISRIEPYTYVIGKCFLAGMIIAAPLMEHRKWGIHKKRIQNAFINFFSVFIMSGSITALAFLLPLPQFIYPEWLISRPVDFFSAILFVIAFILVMRRFLVERDIFSGLILTSIIFNCCGEIYISFSKQLFDGLFNVAHLAHLMGYVMPMVAIPMQGLAELNMARYKIFEHQQNEEELKKHQDYLEHLVQERTQDLAKTNEQLIKQIEDRVLAQQNLNDAYEKLQATHNKLKESQNQLIQSEKMNALGTMVAGVAHEMNNPMMSILNYTQYCLKHTSCNDPKYNTLQDIENETKQCIEIIKNLLTFSRREEEGEEGYQKVHLTEPLDRVLKLISYRIEKQNVLVKKVLDQGLPQIWIKVNNIQQVLFNLIHNALDAVKEQEQPEIYIHMIYRGEYVEITVADNGSGIAPENLEKIFDPFFTTKSIGEGTGLGLSICHTIINAHGGKIDCVSEAGLGARFTVLLPLERQIETQTAR